MSRFAIPLLLLSVLAAGCSDLRASSEDGSRRDIAASAGRVRQAETMPARPSPPQPGPGCFRGRLTDEGDTCQAMRTETGRLITLGGPLRGFAPGDAVCVCGVRADRPFCRQGVTIVIREISDTCADIQ